MKFLPCSLITRGWFNSKAWGFISLFASTVYFSSVIHRPVQCLLTCVKLLALATSCGNVSQSLIADLWKRISLKPFGICHCIVPLGIPWVLCFKMGDNWSLLLPVVRGEKVYKGENHSGKAAGRQSIEEAAVPSCVIWLLSAAVCISLGFVFP